MKWRECTNNKVSRKNESATMTEIERTGTWWEGGKGKLMLLRNIERGGGLGLEGGGCNFD